MLIQRGFTSLVLAGCALSGCERRVDSVSLTDADRNVIRDRVPSFDKAVLAADWPSVVAFYAEDGILLPPNAPMVEGRVAMQKFFEGFPKITEFKQSVAEVEGDVDLVYTRGTYEMTMTPPGAKPQKDRGKVLGVWKKQGDGSWVVSRVSWNSDLAPAR
jgi:ketosteroid isomerase-like protein